jgi:hypothetical protein
MTYHAMIRNTVVAETCPTLDKIAAGVKEATILANRYQREFRDRDDVVDVLRDIEIAMWGLLDHVEEVRDANGKLREALCEALRRIDEPAGTP